MRLLGIQYTNETAHRLTGWLASIKTSLGNITQSEPASQQNMSLS